MNLAVANFGLAGYRSFSGDTQYFVKLAKLNILIGQNNAGKSNVLRFIKEVLGADQGQYSMDRLVQHLPSRPVTRVTLGVSPERVSDLKDERKNGIFSLYASKLCRAKAALDDAGGLCWTEWSIPDRKLSMEGWIKATASLTDQELRALWEAMTGQQSGNRTAYWEPETIRGLAAPLESVKVVVIPAIRQIGGKGTVSDAFDGLGLIERLAKLQNPDVHSQGDRAKFDAISKFLGEVTDRPDAKIEIPYDRDTILVHMDNKVLPIESLGSGIHEVLILAAAATVLEGIVLCIEEPELHLNPILQKKLVRYLGNETSNQYFITSHSAALMDTPGAEVYHVRLEGDSSKVDRVTSDAHRSAICADLGYHPSDLLQANSIIWVEGPSDRIYLNWWLQNADPGLIEGIHYSIMFYGGRLAAHLTNVLDDSEVFDFISLRRLNRRGVMLIDSDKDMPRKQINLTKRRLRDEFDHGPGHAWITAGREIENYLPLSQVKDAITKVSSTSTSTSAMGQYDHMLSIMLPKGGHGQAPKIEIAKFITANYTPDLGVLDLRIQLQKLLAFVHASNPKLSRARE